MEFGPFTCGQSHQNGRSGFVGRSKGLGLRDNKDIRNGERSEKGKWSSLIELEELGKRKGKKTLRCCSVSLGGGES